MLGRANDIQAADFNGDGKLDLVVGVFGNLTTGMLLYLDKCPIINSLVVPPLGGPE
jgi:hypothetical protein